MKRSMGFAGIVLAGIVAGCGNPLPSAPTPSPAAPQTTASQTPSPEPTPTATPTPTPSATPTASATPTPGVTAAPGSTASPSGAAGQVTLPDQVDTFLKVEGRTEGDVRVGAYYSDKLKTVVEARSTGGKSAKELLATQGVTDPATAGPALCGGTRDNLCAQDKGGVAVLLTSKELPGSMLADLTTKFLAAMGKS